jgi:hypothetical protein
LNSLAEVLRFHDVLLLARRCGNSLTCGDDEQDRNGEQALSPGSISLGPVLKLVDVDRFDEYIHRAGIGIGGEKCTPKSLSGHIVNH